MLTDRMSEIELSDIY